MRRNGLARLALLALLLDGCAGVIDVQPLATGRVTVAAYALRGPELAGLRREAARLCPLGGEIQRQAGRDPWPVGPADPLRDLMDIASELFDPPQRAAQLVVICAESPDAALLPAPVAPTAPATPADPPSPLPLPMGPIAVEW